MMDMDHFESTPSGVKFGKKLSHSLARNIYIVVIRLKSRGFEVYQAVNSIVVVEGLYCRQSLVACFPI